MVDSAKILQGRVKIGSLQKTIFKPGRVPAQFIILLMPSLINNIYFVKWVNTKLLKTLTSHSVTIDITG